MVFAKLARREVAGPVAGAPEPRDHAEDLAEPRGRRFFGLATDDWLLVITMALLLVLAVARPPFRDEPKEATATPVAHDRGATVPAGEGLDAPGPEAPRSRGPGPTEAPGAPGGEPSRPPTEPREGIPGLLPPGRAAADSLDASGLSDADAALLGRLRRAVRADEMPSALLWEAEDLCTRNPAHRGVLVAAQSLFERAAEIAGPSDRQRILERATDLWPGTLSFWMRLHRSHTEAGDLKRAELSLRHALSQHGEAGELLEALGEVLIKLDRDPEAAGVLRRSLALRPSARAGQLLASIERRAEIEGRMEAYESAHFALRFEGEEDREVAEAILDILERKHSELSRTLDFAPRSTIPVVLLTRGQFQDTGAGPGWAAGTYSEFDGRIRVKVGRLAGGVDAGLEETLAHELVHAFLAGIPNDVLPRLVEEGLAQYLSGERIVVAPTRAQAQSRQVRDFYRAALSFTEWLVAKHGMASIGHMLKLLQKSGDLNQAFRRAFGDDYGTTLQCWMATLPG